MNFDHFFDTIATLVPYHSPSAMETEIDHLLLVRNGTALRHISTRSMSRLNVILNLLNIG
jgi:hypothetical protein